MAVNVHTPSIKRLRPVLASWLLAFAMPCSLAGNAAPEPERGVIAGGQSLRVAIPQPADAFALELRERGVDLVVDRPDLGPQAFANLPGRRWGGQVLAAWRLPAGTAELVVRPLLINAPAGEYELRWHRLETNQSAQKLVLDALSAAADLAPQRDRESTQATLQRLQLAQEGIAALRLSSSMAADDNLSWLDPAEIWFRIGQLHGRAGDVGAAQSAYEASLALLQNRTDSALGLAHVLDAISMNQLRQGRLQDAVKSSALAARAAMHSEEPYQQAVVSNNACVILRAGADMRAAAACFETALAQYEQAGLVEHQSAVLTNLAAVHTNLGSGHEALAALQRALALRSGAAGEDDDIARVATLVHLAQTQARLGRYQQALRSGHQALTLATELGNDALQQQAVRVLASSHLDLGQVNRARELLRAAQSEPNGASEFGSLRMALTAALATASVQERVRLLAQVTEAAAAAGDDLALARGQLHWAAEADAAALEERVSALRSALALAERHGLLSLQIRANLGLAELLPARADGLLERAQALARSADFAPEQHSIYYAKARLAAAHGQLPQARRWIQAADQLEDQLSLRMNRAQRHQFQRSLRQRQQFALGLVALDDASVVVAADWVLQRLLRNRAQLWREQSRQQLAAARAEYRHALERVEYLTNAIDAVAPSAAAELTLQREAAMAQVEALESAQPKRRERLDLTQIQGQLDGADRLLLLALGSPHSVAVSISKAGVALIPLPESAVLEAAAGSVREGLSRQDPMGQKALARRFAYLSGMLAPAFADAEAPASTYVLSDPELDAVPLEVLAGADPRSSESAERLLRWGIGSGDDWFPPRPALPLNAELVLLHDQRRKLDTDQSLAPLPYAAAEIERIAAQWTPSSTLRLAGPEAAAWLTDHQLRRIGVLHVAAHVVNDELLDASSVLAMGSAANEARVNLGLLRHQSLQTELTVLSGCSSGVGAQGEFRQGFAEAFIDSGSRRVLATLWPVDDEASAAFMDEFYRHLIADLERSPATALAKAKRTFASSARWRDPYWWAGYQLWSSHFGAARLDQSIASNR